MRYLMVGISVYFILCLGEAGARTNITDSDLRLFYCPKKQPVQA